MKQILVILAFFALSLVVVNCQIPAVIAFSTFNDSLCSTGNAQDVSLESNGKCVMISGGASVNITLNTTTTGTIYQYTSPSCTGVSIANVTFTVGQCGRFNSSGSFIVSFNDKLWRFSQTFQSSTACGTNLVSQSTSLVGNTSGTVCSNSACTCFGPICFFSTCSFNPTSCDSALYAVSSTYNTAGCPSTALISQGCTKPNTCINLPNNMSSQVNCAGGQFTSGGTYNKLNCASGGGNITVGNYTAGCQNNGQGFYLTASCTQSTTGSTGGSTGSTSGSSATLITFSLAILVLIIISIIF